MLYHGVWAFGGKAVSAGSGILISIFLTRLLPPAEVGAYFLALSVVTVMALAARAGLEKTLLQLVTESLGAGDEARARSATLRGMAIATGTVGVVSLLIALGGGRWIAAEVFSSEPMARIAVLLAAWMAYLAFEAIVAEIFRGFHDIPRASVYGGAIGRILCVLGLIAMLWWMGSVSLRAVVLLTIACGAFGLIVAFGALARKLRRLDRGAGRAISTSRILRITGPLLVSSLTLFVAGNADLWILGAFRSEGEVALYAVTIRLVLLVGVSLTIVNAVLPPLIGELYVQDQRERLERVIRITAAAAAIPSVIVLAAFIIAGGPILAVAFGPFYRDGAVILGLLSIAQLVKVWVGSCGYVLIMTGHQRDLMWSAVVSGSVSVLGSLATVTRYGAVGVAVAVGAGIITQNLLMLWLAKRRCGVWTHVGPTLLYRWLRQTAVSRRGA